MKAVDGVSFTSARGRDARHRRRVRLREVDARPLPPQAARADLRPIIFEGRDITGLSRREMRPLRREHDDGLPGPVRVAQRAQAGRVHHRRGARAPRHRDTRRAQAARPGAARGRRPQPGALQPLPARVLGRPAAADRRRARARGEPEAHRLRRAGLGARRLRAGADPQSPEGSPAGVRPDLRLHRARPQRRAAHLRPGDGDVPRQGRRDREPRRHLREPEAPVHRGAALRGAAAEPGRRAARGSSSCSRATCRTRSIRRRPATSTRGARASTRATATWRRLRSNGSRPDHLVACHYPLERWPMDISERPAARPQPVETTG